MLEKIKSKVINSLVKKQKELLQEIASYVLASRVKDKEDAIRSTAKAVGISVAMDANSGHLFASSRVGDAFIEFTLAITDDGKVIEVDGITMVLDTSCFSNDV